MSAAAQMAWLATGRIAFLLPMFAVLRWSALVQHNQSHVTLFKRRWANRLLELMLGTATGMPMELYREAHARTHHRHTGTPQDWTQPTQVHDGVAQQGQTMARWRYLYVFAPRAWALGWSSVRRDGAQLRCLRAEMAAMAAVVALPLVLGSPARLLAIGLAWVLVAIVSADANFKHHDGYLVAGQPRDFANDTFSWLHTGLGFNIGYHTSHHARPNAHWTKLPELSAKRAGRMPATDASLVGVAGSRQGRS